MGGCLSKPTPRNTRMAHRQKGSEDGSHGSLAREQLEIYRKGTRGLETLFFSDLGPGR